MNDMIMRESAEMTGVDWMKRMLDQQRETADVIRSMAKRIESLERYVSRLEKVTPAQVREINAMIADVAAAECAAHRARGGESLTRAAIRKDIREGFGVGKVKELSRGDYSAARQLVAAWDDYKVMKAIRKKVSG